MTNYDIDKFQDEMKEKWKYRNSQGTYCNEVCLTCVHKELCFTVLEFCGMVFLPGERIRFDCEEIIADPERYREWVRNWIRTRDKIYGKEEV